MADLLPTIGHIPLPYIMSYDTRPLLSMQEKQLFLKTAVEKKYVLFLQHDAHHELCTLKTIDKAIRLENTQTFNELFSS